MGLYTDYTNGLTAEQLIQMIANDYVELSHDKIRWQRDDYMRICREWLKANIPLEEEEINNAPSTNQEF